MKFIKLNVGVGLASTHKFVKLTKLFSSLSIVNCKLLIVKLFSYSIILFLIISCRHYNQPQLPNDTADIERIKKEILLQVNRELIEEEAQEIKDFIESQNWNMQSTESGLWYMIYGNGKGKKAATGDIVTLDYTLSLMDSTVCYSSSIYGQKKFMVGYGDVESGLQEGVQLMCAGDKARMIMPPHLAHGILGDGDCIPRRTTIIYDVELISIEN